MRLMTYWFGKLNSKLRASQCAYFTTRIHLLGKFILVTNSPESAVDRQEDAGVDWRFCPHTREGAPWLPSASSAATG